MGLIRTTTRNLTGAIIGTVQHSINMYLTSKLLNLFTTNANNSPAEGHDTSLTEAVAEPLKPLFIWYFLVSTIVMLAARLVELREEKPKYNSMINLASDQNTQDTILNEAAEAVAEVKSRHESDWEYAKEGFNKLKYVLPLRFMCVGATVAVAHLCNPEATSNYKAFIAGTGDQLAAEASRLLLRQ